MAIFLKCTDKGGAEVFINCDFVYQMKRVQNLNDKSREFTELALCEPRVIENARILEAGMSGSSILTREGRAVGVFYVHGSRRRHSHERRSAGSALRPSSGLAATTTAATEKNARSKAAGAQITRNWDLSSRDSSFFACRR
jgi:hypothetical protein